MSVYSDNAIAQFENVNSLRRYPFSDECSLVSRDGRELPKDVIVDAHFFVPCEFGRFDDGVASSLVAPVRMSCVHMSPSMISVCFVYGYENVKYALSATVATSSFKPYRPVRLERIAGTEDAGGIVTFGDVEFPGFPETYFFDSAFVHTGCVVASKPVPVRKFVDPRSGNTISGDVEVEFGNFVKASREENKFRLSLEEGAADALASECAEANGYNTCGATPINSINGVRPDEYGNIVLWFH